MADPNPPQRARASDAAEPLTDAELAALADAAAKATPGPWTWEWEDKSVLALYGPELHRTHVLWSQVCKSCQERGYRCTAPSDEDMAYIAIACNAAPRLVAEVRAARDENAKLRRDVEMLCVHGAEPTDEEWRLLREQNAALRARLDALVAAADALRRQMVVELHDTPGTETMTTLWEAFCAALAAARQEPARGAEGTDGSST